MKILKYILLVTAFAIAQFSSLYANANKDVKKDEIVAAEIAHKQAQENLDRMARENAENVRHVLDYIVDSVRGNFPSLANLFDFPIFGIKVIQYIASIFILFFTFALTKYILSFIFGKVETFFKTRSKKNLAPLFISRIKRPINMLAWVLGVYFALAFLLQDAHYVAISTRAVGILFWCAVFWTVLITCDITFVAITLRLKARSASSIANLLEFINRVVKIFIFIIALLSVLSHCGMNVNTIVASLGIGGMALAFASQDTIANFFGSVSIIIDRPFIVGDWVKTSKDEGTVEAIGFRSTRIRTFTKTLITIPNSILAKESIENLSKMPVRKVSQVLGLTYATTADQIEKFLPDLRDTVLSVEGVDKTATPLVEFTNFGASSLDISLTYFTLDTSLLRHNATKRCVNLAIMRLLEKHGLAFAFPSTSIYVEQLPKQN